jgi:hypothetical protein
MRWAPSILALLLLGASLYADHRRPSESMPDRLEIGRHTFFDNGADNFYEVFLVRPEEKGTSIQRVRFKASRAECERPENLEFASATASQSLESLLGSSNPCAIPEKELQRELKRCKHRSGYSFSNVSMQVHCGAQTRFIRADVFDRDWFGPGSNSRKNTNWTMDFLQRLDRALGEEIMQQPVFPSPQQSVQPKTELDPALRKTLEDGGYDALFPGAPHKLSEFFACAAKESAALEVQFECVSPRRLLPLTAPSSW